ncbi:hypothetical protein BDN72DRAFT_246908 [Pluteus cervinus]|uniref:Uncharacterized protein n=1 Tax=Pluteus cervinus TaxID=181527 RepID=A0ACD3B4W0_9AGAR|nr:hypothetical protein BDN72DRAFT_246908 [Pluteus cervinus]
MSAQSRALSIPEILDLIFGNLAIEDDGLLAPKTFGGETGSDTDALDWWDSGSDSESSDSDLDLGLSEDSDSDSMSSLSSLGSGILPFRTHIPGMGKRSALFSAALTCRRFTPSALRVLWRTMDSLDPLISVLPVDITRSRKRLLAAEIPPEAWAKFEAYGNRIHVLTLSKKGVKSMTCKSRNRSVYVALFAMNRLQLPSLRALIITRLNNSACLTICSSLLASPRLDRIRIDSVASRDVFASFCTILHHTAQQPLHSFLVNSVVRAADLESIISPTLHVLQVGIGRKGSDLQKLANLPLLRELYLRLAGDMDDISVSLPSLKVLRLSGKLNSISGFLSSCRCDAERVSIKLPDDWHLVATPGPEPGILFAIISKRWKNNIKHIELDCSSYKKPLADVWDNFLETITPLQDIPLLTLRILNSPFRLDSKDIILSVPQYFPHIQTLELPWSKTPKGLTFRQLRSLAEGCPHLQYLGVTVTLQANLSKLPVLNHGLKALNVLNSTTTVPALDTASNLHRIFPLLTRIETTSFALKHEKWKDVERMLELLHERERVLP